MNQKRSISLSAAVSLFFVSGITSLVYETLWIRILSLSIGSTAAAVGVTLAIFFTGLGIGGALSGKIIARAKQPFRTYAILEAIIAVTSAVACVLLIQLNDLVSFFNAPLGVDSLLRYGTIFILLIIPTIAMGATLPVLIAFFSIHAKSTTRPETIVSFLYGLNTLGGALGAVIGSYFVIPIAGLLWGAFATCFVNLCLAVFALGIGQNIEQKTGSLHTKGRERLSHPSSKSALSQGHLLAIAAVSGFSSIAAEVVWNKYLAIFFGTNIFGIGTVLAIFLLGLAIGPFVLAKISHRVRSLDQLLLAALLAAAVLTPLSGYALGLAPHVIQSLNITLATYVVPIKGLLAFAIIFPTSAVYGLLFPVVAVLLAQKQKTSEAESTGYTYAVNTAGSVLGSLSAGLWLTPVLGSYVTSNIASSLYALAALSVLIALPSQRFVPKYLTAAVFAGVFVGTTALAKFDFRTIIESARSYRSSNVVLGQEDFKLIIEGQNTLVSLSHDPMDGAASKNYLRLKTSGLYESVFSMDGSRVLPRYEGLLGILPWLAKPDAKEVFVVGFGAGYTVDLLTSLPIAKVQAVELEQGVIDAFKYAVPNASQYLTRPNLDLSIGDARYALQRSKTKFDFIVSQPSHSWLPGSANLFTEEYFELVSSKLNDSGVFAQWLNLYNSQDDAVRSILKAFFKKFPHGSVFTLEGDEELILLGSKIPLRMDPLALDRALSGNPNLAGMLANLPITTFKFKDILPFYLADSSSFAKDLEKSVVNTDRNAFAEVVQSKQFYITPKGHQDVKAYLQERFDTRFQGLPYNFPMNTDGQISLLESYVTLKQYQRLLKVIPSFLTADFLTTGQKARLVTVLRHMQLNSEALRLAEEVVTKDPTEAHIVALLGVLSDRDEFSNLLQKHKTLSSIRRSLLADCYAANAVLELRDQSAAARRLLSSIKSRKKDVQTQCGVYSQRIFGLMALGDQNPNEAMQQLETYLASYPNDAGILARMPALSQNLRDTERFNAYLLRWRTQSQSEVQRLLATNSVYREAGFQKDAELLRQTADALSKRPNFQATP